jgi:hypothetical protein
MIGLATIPLAMITATATMVFGGFELFKRYDAIAISIDTVKHLFGPVTATAGHLVNLQDAIAVVIVAFNHAGCTSACPITSGGDQFVGRQAAITICINIGKAGFALGLQFFQRKGSIAVQIKRCEIGTLAVIFSLRCTGCQNHT